MRAGARSRAGTDGDAYNVEAVYHWGEDTCDGIPGLLLKREFEARGLNANRLAQGLGVPSGRITDILNEKRGISADPAVRLGRYFGNRAQFWLDLQGQYDIALVAGGRFE